MQDLTEKAHAIASVVWLLPEHYSMIRITRSGCIVYANELEQDGGWQPPVPPEFEGWPVEELQRWWSYQRRMSAKYRLWPVGIAMQKLADLYREQANAVVMECVEGGLFTWYDPNVVSERCHAGLLFMAGDVPGDVPFFQEAAVDYRRNLSKPARNRRIAELDADGASERQIARELGCSRATVEAVLRGQVVRRGRAIDAVGA